MKLENLPKTLRGERVQSGELAGFTLIETIYSSGFKMPRHSHELTHFSLVLQGTYTERYGRRSRAGKPSTLVIHPPNEDHSVNFDNTGARIFSVVVKPHWLKRVREHTSVLDNTADFRGGLPVTLALRLYHECQEMDEVSPLIIEGLSLEILSAAHRLRERDKAPRWLIRARDLLHARFYESLSLDDIAKAVGVHSTHLSRVFRRQFGCTVGEYVRQLRIEHASRQLSTSDIPLHEIAASAGFSDQSHFARTFKRYMQISPNQYRRIARPR
ncbi:MAG TPA: AraC family transcriptional regulator [Pyrinomonadaceae bacterium]|jgi:AraC family transcriptional regulator